MSEGSYPCSSFVYAHWPCMNYITAILLLVSCMSTHNHFLQFAQCREGSTPKLANKSIQQISQCQVSKPCHSHDLTLVLCFFHSFRRKESVNIWVIQRIKTLEPLMAPFLLILVCLSDIWANFGNLTLGCYNKRQGRKFDHTIQKRLTFHTKWM